MWTLIALGVVFLVAVVAIGHRQRRGGDGTRVQHEDNQENLVAAEGQLRRLLGPIGGGG